MEEMIYNQQDEDLLDDEKVELTWRQKIWRWLKAFIALLAIAGVLYLSGIYQYLFFHRTPANIQIKPEPSVLQAETISLPLDVYIIKGIDYTGSIRSPEAARQMVEQASNIWQQADINLEIAKLEERTVSATEQRLFLDSPAQFIEQTGNYNPEHINVFLLDALGGINGVAFGGLYSVAVADYTAGFDFRTLAHEIGHVLGLNHITNDQGRLMYSGATGNELNKDEIEKARANAAEFIKSY